jgi:hypothetical protein
MVTITNRVKDEGTLERFPQIGGKIPLFLGRQQSNTRFFPKKKYIIISARVHPSEVASSFVLKAFIKFILKHRFVKAKK